MTTRVDIFKEQSKSIIFPSICPVCGIGNPGSSINMRTYISMNQPLKEKIGDHWNLDIPVCEKHKKNIRIGRIVSGLLFFLMVIVSVLVFYGFWLILGEQHWVLYTIIGIGILSGGIYLHPKIYSAPLLLESFSYRLLFTFRSDILAEKFARVNKVDEVYNSMNQSRKITKEESI